VLDLAHIAEPEIRFLETGKWHHYGHSCFIFSLPHYRVSLLDEFVFACHFPLGAIPHAADVFVLSFGALLPWLANTQSRG